MNEWIVTYDDDGNEIVKGKLVRCKDCIYSYGTLKYCSIDHWVNKDGTSFCSSGERKNEMDLDEVNK